MGYLKVDTYYSKFEIKNQCILRYSFGSAMEGRTYSSGTGYKYGFNGKEKDDEVSGEGNSYTAKYWQYDGRLGRRFNLDPRPIAGISAYACFANNPIWFTDPFGDTLAPAAQAQADRLRTEGTERIEQLNELKSNLFDLMCESCDNDALWKEIENINSAIGEIQSFMDDIELLEESAQLYDVMMAEGSTGSLSYDKTDGALVIVLATNPSSGHAAHEFKHAIQFEKGEATAITANGLRSPTNDILDEVTAYKVQWAYDYFNANGIKNLGATNYEDVNSTMVYSIQVNGVPLYTSENFYNGTISVNSTINKSMLKWYYGDEWKQHKNLIGQTVEEWIDSEHLQILYK